MDDPREDSQERKHHIANLLLANRGEGTDWGEWQTEGKPWSKRMANYFLLASALEWRIPSELAWQNAERLVKQILGDPDDLWQAITSVSHSEWKSKHYKNTSSTGFTPPMTAYGASESASAMSTAAMQGAYGKERIRRRRLKRFGTWALASKYLG